MTTVLGIDPGTRSTGYGVVQADKGRMAYIACGCIRPAAESMPGRLGEIHVQVSALIAAHDAAEVSIEDVFLSRNPQSALKLGQARGAAIAAAVAAGRPVFEYAPRSIKKAVVGFGGATKEQVQHMVRVLLNLGRKPPSADAADALAIAICHVNTVGLTLTRVARLRPGR